MSIMKIPQIMDRIKSAHYRSRIAVFRSGEPGYLDAVFADTAETQSVIANGSTTFIGAYHGDMDLRVVKKFLEDHVIPETCG